MSGPLLAVRRLGVNFPRGGWLRPSVLRAVHEVSFDVNRGESVALVGESGSGKSTIGRVIVRLQRATTGAVELDGVSVPVTTSGAAPRSYRRRVQMVFQDPYASLNPVHRVRYHIERPLRLHRGVSGSEAARQAAALLDAVGLSPAADFLERFPHELSGGQRQRVAIARALAPQPELLVADEPTASLDVSIRMEVLELLRSLQREQSVGVLLITHDLAAARWTADRVVVLYAGQIMEQGPADEIFSSPAHPYTRLLVAAASRAAGALPAKSGAPPVLNPGPGCPFAARCPEAEERCHTQSPATSKVSPDHSVHCHLAS